MVKISPVYTLYSRFFNTLRVNKPHTNNEYTQNFIQINPTSNKLRLRMDKINNQ